ncbi:MAG: ribosome recycling factor [Bacillota bacterium]|nr:ribosome recycling factor [Bacillota bacterium]HPZ53929.1 ribosome recycling factor [Bacillota bacterium]HQD18131.1 ribosome recycling factor [Bacillota bacterium]
MQAVIQTTKKEFASIRTGRANPALLDGVLVDYYNTPTPLNQLASISVPEPRLLVLQPYDKSAISNIEKAILKADLGLNPTNDGNVIRVSIPHLTEERRRDLVKVARKKAEELKVAVRNARRDANEALKKLEKEKSISEDELRIALEEVQELTDKYITEIDNLLKRKEEEIMEV